MDTFLILSIVVIFITFIATYAIKEGQRIESQKKFMKNMNDFDKKNKK